MPFQPQYNHPENAKKYDHIFGGIANRAQIRIGDTLENNGNSNPRRTVISRIPPGFTESFQCNGMDGRYVNIVIPGKTDTWP
ncbi:Fucolectin-4 [Dissostichus eleginoides]|uniref:Fucolectin-4 n=1 Tax=Dissostichus eleginoides TaxID=100907 RepID=A0AAD9C5S7_DISEL|nr:Fucolectin-4 [Dissostichus eleginoides]